MKAWIFLLLSIAFAFFQGTLLPTVLVEGFLITVFVSSAKSQLKLSTNLFLSGLMFDLVQSQTLGVTSIIFLISSLFFGVGERVFPRADLLLIISALLINSVREFAVIGHISMPSLLLTAILALIIFRFIYRPLPRELRIHD